MNNNISYDSNQLKNIGKKIIYNFNLFFQLFSWCVLYEGCAVTNCHWCNCFMLFFNYYSNDVLEFFLRKNMRHNRNNEKEKCTK